MSSLPGAVYVAADKLGVVVYRARSDTVKRWNDDRGKMRLRHFCGFYWYLRTRSGSQATHGFGPFMSESAAYAHAIGELETLAATTPRIANVLRENYLIPTASRPRQIEGRKYVSA